MGDVDFGGVIKRVCLALTPDADLGDYTVVHAGFAIAIIDEEAAQTSLDLFEEIGIIAPGEDEVAS